MIGARGVALVLGLTLAAPLSAQGFVAQNRVEVSGTATQITVAGGGGFGARGAWCAAADYAHKVLGAAGTQRIYVAKAQGKGSRAPVTFTLNAKGLTPVSVMITGASLRIPGANLSVDHAQSFCADARVINR